MTQLRWLQGLRGLRRVLAAVWLGWVTTLGSVTAPVLFDALQRSQAGLLAGHLFKIEAHAALFFGIVLLATERICLRPENDLPPSPRFSLDFAFLLGAVFCTVFGYFALQPLMADARAGVGIWSFGALHAASGALFAIKAMCLTAFVWRQR